MNSTNYYFTTGEFAKLLGVKKHTLFHYNEIGLLTPQYEKENGYRYYFLWQINQFRVIRILQKLNMSLKEIMHYMNQRSPEEFSHVITMKEHEIDEEIQRLKNMKKFLGQQKEKILEYQKCVLNSPRLISLKAKAILLTPIPDDCPSQITHAIWQHLQLREEKHLSDGSICATYRIEDFQNGRFDYYNAVYTELDTANTMSDYYIFPAGQYLQIYCRDEVNSIQQAYEQLQLYAKENNLCLGNIFYGDVLLDELTSSQYRNYILKMLVAVR